MKTTCIPTKELYWNPLTNYRIISCVSSYTQRGITVNKYGNFTLCGDNLKFIQIDKRYDLDIEPVVNSKYPHTYKLIGFSNISTNNEQVVVDVDAECKILSRFMTEQQARNVHEIYPHFVQDVLNQQTDGMSHKNIKNVGPKRLQEYFTKIQEDYQYILFWNTCTQYGITENKVINLAASEYNSIEQFIEELKSSPYYTLIKKLDIGFASADKKILNHFPEFKVSDERCKYLILHLLHKHVENGHTRIQAEQLAKIAWEYAPELVDLIPSTITKCDEIYYDSNTQYASIRLVYQQEQYIADEILRRVNQTKTPLSISDWKQFTTVDGFTCTDEQSQILKYIAEGHHVLMLSGSAGVGKTSSIKALINMLEHMYIDYTMVAPTGIAAKRLRISTGRTASTIHMLLVHHEPVGKYVIVDEFSMIGVGLLYDLLNHIPNDTNLIFVCDEAQLASISYGNVLYDIIKSGKVPKINLTKVFRYGTNSIATIATDIRNGNISNIHQPFDDFYFIDNMSNIYNTLENLYNNLLQTGYSDEDIMILTPQNKGQYGTYNINNFIQKIHNDNESTGVVKHPMKNIDIDFKLQDIVLNTHNEYAVVTQNDIMAVMNGDIGRLITYDKQESKTTFEIVFDTGTAYMSNEQLNNLLLGYAMTIHKVQGSQNKVVIVIVDDSHKHMLSRNLLYVAASRAQEKLYIIANENTLKDALQIEETQQRDTWLFDLLTQERGE